MSHQPEVFDALSYNWHPGKGRHRRGFAAVLTSPFLSVDGGQILSYGQGRRRREKEQGISQTDGGKFKGGSWHSSTLGWCLHTEEQKYYRRNPYSESTYYSYIGVVASLSLQIWLSNYILMIELSGSKNDLKLEFEATRWPQHFTSWSSKRLSHKENVKYISLIHVCVTFWYLEPTSFQVSTSLEWGPVSGAGQFPRQPEPSHSCFSSGEFGHIEPTQQQQTHNFFLLDTHGNV